MSSESKNTGTYTFEIDGYSLKIKSIGVGGFVRSGTFTVGGLDWAIRFCPNGIHEYSKQYIVVSLELMSSNAEARARYVFKVFNHGAPAQVRQIMLPIQTPGSAEVTELFKSCDATRYGLQKPVGLLKSLLECWRGLGYYLVNDRLRIQCQLTVIRESLLFENRAEPEIEVPPCDMMEHLATC